MAPIRPGGLPHVGAASTPAVFLHTFSRPPIGFAGSCTQAAFPYGIADSTCNSTATCFPIRFSGSPQAGHLLIRFSTAPPYNRQAPKIPTLVSTRPAFPAPQTRHPSVSTNSLRRLPARYRMSRRGTKPAETSARSTQMRIRPTHSNSLRRRGGHGYGIASRCDDAASASTSWGATACYGRA